MTSYATQPRTEKLFYHSRWCVIRGFMCIHYYVSKHNWHFSIFQSFPFPRATRKPESSLFTLRSECFATKSVRKYLRTSPSWSVIDRQEGGIDANRRSNHLYLIKYSTQISSELSSFSSFGDRKKIGSGGEHREAGFLQFHWMIRPKMLRDEISVFDGTRIRVRCARHF
jgi:hypothetical protein